MIGGDSIHLHDLIYHLLVLLEATGCSIADLEQELARRHA